MRKLWIFTGIVAMFLLPLTLSDNAFAKSAENKAACIQWCKAHKPECVKCHTNTTCGGRSWKVIQSFKKGTGNWYACGLSEYALASQNNKADCEVYCKKERWCEFCRDKVSCGLGYTSVRTFGGRGENWYACALTVKERNSRMNEEECKKYCDNIPDCDFCSSRISCEGHYLMGGGGTAKRRATFGGRGENWYACQFTAKALATMEREEVCENMCKSSDFCDFCTTVRSACGAGKKVVARFKGRGGTVYACKRR